MPKFHFLMRKVFQLSGIYHFGLFNIKSLRYNKEQKPFSESFMHRSFFQTNILWVLLFIFFLGSAHAQKVVPKTKEFYVNDTAKLLSAETKEYILKTNQALNQATGAQVVVVTVPDLKGATIEDYALKLFRQYKIGNKKKNNGVLLLVALRERQSRIEVGYGLEGVLNDGKVGRIQDTYMVPYFVQNNWDTGLKNGFHAVVSEIATEYRINLKDLNNTPQVHQNSKDAEKKSSGWLFDIFLLIICLGVGLFLGKITLSKNIGKRLLYIGIALVALVIGTVLIINLGKYLFSLILGGLGLFAGAASSKVPIGKTPPDGGGSSGGGGANRNF